ncbi:MAG TPA: DUF4010 domain-containing protein [Terriglobales bacterium]|nr:DUF4010 domain-containing protein [Terriglobales bacterium]
MSLLFQEAARFPPETVAVKIAISLAVGMLVGFERESANKDVGIRTFGLTALLGALSVLISPAYGLAAMLGVIVLVAFLNARSMIGSRTLEITTSAALLVTYALGALVGLGHTFTPVASAILMTLLLAWKVELRKFAGGVSMDELRGAVLLGLIGLVIYPVLPDRFIDRWELVNLRQAWVTVVVIASIAFVNYVLLRLYSTRGLYWTAILGGLVNSRAAVAELMTVGTGSRTTTVVLLATIAMFIRNIVLLALFAPRALLTAVGPLFAMACVALLLRTGKSDDEPGRELTLGSPISLRRVLSYGLLFIAIEVVGTLAQRAFGAVGFLAASGISGIASSASAAAAAANLSASAKITPELAGTAAVLASMASALTNVPLVFKRLSRTLLLRVASSTALQIIVGIAVLAAQHYILFR